MAPDPTRMTDDDQPGGCCFGFVLGFILYIFVSCSPM